MSWTIKRETAQIFTSNICPPVKNLGVTLGNASEFDPQVGLAVKNSFFQFVFGFCQRSKVICLQQTLNKSPLLWFHHSLIIVIPRTLALTSHLQLGSSGPSPHVHVTSATSGLTSLHWLPVQLRITFELLLLRFKALHAPEIQ